MGDRVHLLVVVVAIGNLVHFDIWIGLWHDRAIKLALIGGGFGGVVKGDWFGGAPVRWSSKLDLHWDTFLAIL